MHIKNNYSNIINTFIFNIFYSLIKANLINLKIIPILFRLKLKNVHLIININIENAHISNHGIIIYVYIYIYI